MLAIATSTPLLLSASMRTTHVVPLSPRFASEQTMFISSMVQDIVIEPCAVAVATVVVVSDDVGAIVVEVVNVVVVIVGVLDVLDVFSSNTDDCATAEMFPLIVSEEVDVLPTVVVMLVVFSSNTDGCATAEVFPVFVSEEVDILPTVVVVLVVLVVMVLVLLVLLVVLVSMLVFVVLVVVVVLSVVLMMLALVLVLLVEVGADEGENPKVDLMAVKNNTNLIMFVISGRSGWGLVTR
mmetsp:Transcript_31700/g.84637  ORF Transcript_31700/g.84637 Transcript_31700/m.84637 type:complete len:238 (-) Transcript_31700:42-755(-)